MRRQTSHLPAAVALAMAAALSLGSGGPAAAQARTAPAPSAAGPVRTQPEPPGSPLLVPDDRPVTGAVAPLSGTGSSLTIQNGTLPQGSTTAPSRPSPAAPVR